MKKSDIGSTPGQKIQAVGMSWFHEADYAAARAIMSDAPNLPPTFAAWTLIAEQRERELTAQGHKVIRAIIDPKAFAAWCASRGYANIDARARIAFASEYAASQIGS